MWAHHEDGFKDTYEYQTITAHLPEETAFSYALRLLVHYVGDVHQPLHTTSRIGVDFPEGDDYGHLFPLPD